MLRHLRMLENGGPWIDVVDMYDRREALLKDDLPPLSCSLRREKVRFTSISQEVPLRASSIARTSRGSSVCSVLLVFGFLYWLIES